MARKFYYNGQLIRTSENHIYTHALLDTDGKLQMCSSTKEGCEKEQRTRINHMRTNIQNETARLKAIETGKNSYPCKDGGHTFYCPISKDPEGREEEKMWAQKNIEYFKRQIEYIEKYQIVELEER